ncbi:hypothetical protein QBC38DRAFT_491217 [Podospora fimiseda]|uniref:Uncharacterized protein n=1 Tax=Podospora fimiseda TaxID=252190 RepID=A0AAN6YN58_9PEZI|nr:hypothetical protein QBC38DRAFT_491217 [Podospora fimiseda]
MLRPVTRVTQRAPATLTCNLPALKQCRTFSISQKVCNPTEDTKPPKTPPNPPTEVTKEGNATLNSEEKKKKKKTLQEIDEELKQKMEGISGDGGASGVEYEDGKPAGGYKRSVRENMFRYI